MVESKMILSVQDVIEHEDGSATVTFDFDAETTQALISYAINDILAKAVQDKKTQNEVHPDC